MHLPLCLPGMAEGEIADAVLAAAGESFNGRVEEAICKLVAGDEAGFSAFAPAVRAVAGWRHGGHLGDQQYYPNPSPNIAPHSPGPNPRP